MLLLELISQMDKPIPKSSSPLMTEENIIHFTELARIKLTESLNEIESYPEQENEYIKSLKKRIYEELEDLDMICAKMIRVVKTYKVYTIEEIKEVLKKDPMI